MRKLVITPKDIIEKVKATSENRQRFFDNVYVGKGYSIKNLLDDLEQLEYQNTILKKAVELKLLSRDEKRVLDEIRYDCDGYKV